MEAIFIGLSMMGDNRPRVVRSHAKIVCIMQWLVVVFEWTIIIGDSVYGNNGGNLPWL